MPIVVLVISLLLVPGSDFAACFWSGNTGTVASPYDDADLADCVTDAATKTGVVLIQIPNATVTWNATITVDMSDVTDPAPNWTNVTSLTIRGQNDCTLNGDGQPTDCPTTITDFVLAYTGKEGKAFRLAHLEIAGTSGAIVKGDGKSWRFDHLFFDTVTGVTSNRIFFFQKTAATHRAYGLLDHNHFKDWGGGGTIMHDQPSAATADGGNDEWMTGPELGTANGIYFEQNLVTHASGGRYVTDNNGPTKWVIRYNSITNAYIAGHDAQVGGYRGSLKLEAYNNTFNYTASSNCFVMYRAGANGVFFNNTITWSGAGELCGSPLYFANYRNDGAYGWPAACSNTSGKMTLNTNTAAPAACESGTGCIDTDGSSASPNGYPCRDQVGVSGNSPQTGGGAPFLFWNNTINGADASSKIGVGYGADHIDPDRDYCTHATTLPATCNGVTTSTYWPGAYTYPHPLQTEAVVSTATHRGLSIGGGVSIR